MNTGIKAGSGRGQYGKMGGGCTNPPSAPNHAKMQCSSASNSCKATCDREYKFPNGDSVLYISCINNEWTIKDSEWDEIPGCERELRRVIVGGITDCLIFQPSAHHDARTTVFALPPANAPVRITSWVLNVKIRRSCASRSRICHLILESLALLLNVR